jgi:hypothetical protein
LHADMLACGELATFLDDPCARLIIRPRSDETSATTQPCAGSALQRLSLQTTPAVRSCGLVRAAVPTHAHALHRHCNHSTAIATPATHTRPHGKRTYGVRPRTRTRAASRLRHPALSGERRCGLKSIFLAPPNGAASSVRNFGIPELDARYRCREETVAAHQDLHARVATASCA